MVDENMLSGICLSEGMAMGKVYIYQDMLQISDDFYNIEEFQVKSEMNRIKIAIDDVIKDLRISYHRISTDVDSELGEIFKAQELMLRDMSLEKELLAELEKELTNAEQIVIRIFNRWQKIFIDLPDPTFQQKSEDMIDLCRRVVNSLKGIHANPLENVPSGSIIVAKRLLPSDTVFLSRKSVNGVVLEEGGPASHAAILTREFGIPAIGQVSDLLKKVHIDDIIMIDAEAEIARINPKEIEIDNFQIKKYKVDNTILMFKKRCKKQAITRCGRRITVMANIGCREDAQTAVENGAEGIGLFRTETLYMSKKHFPEEDEIYSEMKNILQPCEGLNIVARLLDIGADKSLPYLKTGLESNPVLGLRGIRLLLAYPELLRTQIKTILKLRSIFDIDILIPMVTVIGDIQATITEMEICMAAYGFRNKPRMGSMIETPAAALDCKRIASHVDFLSIGTNDLTQYTMAACRESTLVSNYFIEDHPAVLKLVSMTVEQSLGRPLAVCGEIASNCKGIKKLLSLGIRTLSVSPSLIPAVKQKIREISLKD